MDRIDLYMWSYICNRFLDQVSRLRLIQTCKYMYQLKNNIISIECNDITTINDILKFSNLRSLYVNENISVSRHIDRFTDLTSLYCRHCETITNVDELFNLTYLDCRVCPNITNIEKLVNLTYLECWCCPNITNVEKLVNLTYLDCRNCPNITNVEKLIILKQLSR